MEITQHVIFSWPAMKFQGNISLGLYTRRAEGSNRTAWSKSSENIWDLTERECRRSCECTIRYKAERQSQVRSAWPLKKIKQWDVSCSAV